MMGKATIIPARPLTENPRRNQSLSQIIRDLNFGRYSRPSSPQLQSPPQLPNFRRRSCNDVFTQPPEITAGANALSHTSKRTQKMPILSPQTFRSTRILTTAGPSRNDAERLAMRAHRFLNLPSATKTTGKVTLRTYDRPAPRRVITEPNFLESKSEVPQNDVKLFAPTHCEVVEAETHEVEMSFADLHDDNNDNQNGYNDDDQNGDKDEDQNGDKDESQYGDSDDKYDDQNGDLEDDRNSDNGDQADNQNGDLEDDRNSDNGDQADNQNGDLEDERTSDNGDQADNQNGDIEDDRNSDNGDQADNQNGDLEGDRNSDNGDQADNQNGHKDASEKIPEAVNEFSGLDSDDTVEFSLEFRKKIEQKALRKELAAKTAVSSGGSSPEASTEVSSINDEPSVSNDLPVTPQDTIGVCTRSRSRGGNGNRYPPRRGQPDDGTACYRHIHWKKMLLITYLRSEIGNASGERAAERIALERIRSSWSPQKSRTRNQKSSPSGVGGVQRKRQVSRRRQVTTDKKMKK